MAKGSDTRSGMLWEVERILNECVELGTLPHVLIMENVTQVHSKDNMHHFQAWIKALEKLGYSSYWKDLNAKDYGIPQNRDRTFMVSILGDWYYEFPKKIQLKLRLKDMLEDNVDERFYLSERTIKQISKWNAQQDPLANAKTEDDNILQCITVKSNTTLNVSMLLLKEKPKIVVGWEIINHSYTNGLDGKNPNSRTKLEDYIECDNGIMPCLTTRPDCLGYVERIEKMNNDVSGTLLGSGNQNGIVENNGQPICLNSKGGRGGVEGLQPSLQDRVYSSSSSVAITTGFHPSYTDKEELRIRKLTPRECFRLMGVKDENFENVAKNQSDSSLYHLAGDSIVVNVLMAIFGELIK